MKSVIKYIIYSSLFEIILGTILHFTYNWSNNSLFVGTFSAVNESTWEHLKLAFFPMLISTLLGLKYFKNNTKYLCSRVIAIFVSIIFITSFFYTYIGIFGYTTGIVNISSFIFAIILGELSFYIALKHNFSCNSDLAKLILIILSFVFIFFTFSTPRIPLFKDPLTNTYGINEK